MPSGTVIRIPRSPIWDRAREQIKPALRIVGGDRAYHLLGRKYFWFTVFVNYLLMRSRRTAKLLGVGAWPQSLYIEGTNICNARCVFCAYPQMQRPKLVMGKDQFRKVIDEYVEMGGSEVDLTPIVGDPFVDRHLFDRMDYLDSLPQISRFHFFTNAILLKTEYYPKLLKYGGKLSVYTSFGGFDRETYHKVMGVDKFDKAVTGIRGLIDSKRQNHSAINIQVNLRVPNGNKRGEFWDYLVRACDEGLITIGGMDTFDSWAGKISELDLKSAGLAARPMPVKRGPCHRLLTSPTILADGRVNACACRDVEAELVIGDLKKQSLPEILGGDALHTLIEQHDTGHLPPVCERCTFYEPIYPAWMRGRLYPVFARLFGGRLDSSS